jgi:sugar lactone lactonase YvrE
MNAVYEVDPIAKTKTLFTSGDIDGLALSSNGSTLYSLNEDTGMITGYSTTTGGVVFNPLFVSTQIDGAVQGLPTLGNNLFVNTRDGKIIEVNLTNRTETTIADGGSRGDFASVDRINNTLLFTQSDSIVRLSLAQVSAVPLPPGIWAGAVTALGGLVISRRRAGIRASAK